MTALTFSLTVVTLQLASSQFSPRLLRTFSRDRFVHVTLGLFLGTFTYALAVLRTVRNARGGQPVFVPQLSVTVAFVLCVLSVLGLVLFLAHLAQQIRVETMLRNVHHEASDTVKRVLGARESGPGTETPPTPPPGAVVMLAAASGFLVQIDEQTLLSAAGEADAIILVECWPGSSVISGTPIGAAWPRTESGDPELITRLAEHAPEALTVGFERTAVQDVGYGLRQLADVTNKALSPGINDPTTAVHALGHCSALLCELAGKDLGPRLLYDDHAQLRVVLNRPGFPDMLESAITQPRRYGAEDPFVLGRLFELLAEVAWCARYPDQREAITDQLRRLRATAAAQDFDRTEVDRLAGLAQMVRSAQATRSPPDTSSS